MRSLSFEARPLALILFLGGVGDVIVQAFGRGNLGFLLVTLMFMIVEMFTCMGISALSPDERDDFSFRDVIEFWIKKAILLCLPLVGAAVDWAYYWMGDPDTILAAGELDRFTTKAIAIGILGYQLKQVLVNVLKVYKDLPLALALLRMVDSVRFTVKADGETPPPKPDRRWYDKHAKDPYSDLHPKEREEAHDP